jgi:hypothetical protein
METPDQTMTAALHVGEWRLRQMSRIAFCRRRAIAGAAAGICALVRGGSGALALATGHRRTFTSWTKTVSGGKEIRRSFNAVLELLPANHPAGWAEPVGDDLARSTVEFKAGCDRIPLRGIPMEMHHDPRFGT